MPHQPITEEPLDLYLNRPLAKVLVRLLYPTPVTANQLTVFACLVGVSGGVMIALATPAWVATGAVLVWVFLILDCADGEMARRKGGGSRLGRILDGFSDYLVAIAMHLGLLILAIRIPAFDGVSPWVIFLVVLLAGVCKAVHSALYDAAKQRFRAGLGHTSSGLESMDVLRAAYAEAIYWSERWFLRIYMVYTAMQRTSGGVTHEDRPPSQAEFLAWTLLGPTLRTMLVSAVLLAYLWEPSALAAYPVFGIGVFNVWLVLLMIWRKVSARRPAPAAEQESARP
jgi:phosphatidylglycerophosphate synthase